MSGPVDAKLATLVVGVIAVVTPIIITVSLTTVYVSIIASTWMLDLFDSVLFFTVNGPTELVVTSPLTVLRLVFVFQMFRYYSGKSTRSRTVLIGIVTELPLWGSFILFIVPSLWGPTLTVPLPFSLVVGMLMVWKRPYVELKTPWEEQNEPQ